MTSPSGIPQRRRAADWIALGVACPRCHGELRDDPTPNDEWALVCGSCGVHYPTCSGIPDLRTGDDPYLTKADDWDAAQRLADRAESLSFAALYASYYDGNEKVTAEQAAQFTRGVLAAGERASASLLVWTEIAAVPLGETLAALEIGCGTAPLGIALAHCGARVVGLDVGMRWLVLARKRSAEEGIDLPVVCANAEALPVRDQGVGLVVGESVLENLADGPAALAECRRVIAPHGAVCLTTPNRHSLAPDPHLGVLAGGWWPESRLRAYAQRLGQVFPVRTLYTVTMLRRALVHAGFRDVRVALPRFAAAQVATLPAPARAVVAAYHVARTLPLVRNLVMAVAPTLVCTATRA